jgi:hypothetical protein
MRVGPRCARPLVFVTVSLLWATHLTSSALDYELSQTIDSRYTEVRIPVVHDGVLHALPVPLANAVGGDAALFSQHTCALRDGQEADDCHARPLCHKLCELFRNTSAATPPEFRARSQSALVWLERQGSTSAKSSPTQLHRNEIAQWKPTLSPALGNHLLAALVRSRKPFLVARMGLGTEPIAGFEYLSGRRHYGDALRSILRRDVGVYPPTDTQIDIFAAEYTRAVAHADVVAKWGDVRMPGHDAEEFILRSQALSKPLIHPRALEPYYHGSNGPWTSWLKNRTVLVVHPFTESIATQYSEHRTDIFPGTDILPTFKELKVVQCVQSAVNETPHQNWTESLEFMKQQIEGVGGFDVALLGCGGYGLPLAAHIKTQLNRSAVYLGGAVQVLFGIRGRRWDNHDVISRLYNEHWTRPRPSETPPNAQAVEGGCYW